MADLLQFKRGLKTALPSLSIGEPALVVDEKRIYIGGTNGNIGLPNADDLASINTEVSTARNGETNLNARLNKTDSTLADNALQITNISTPSKVIKVIASFVDDDGTSSFITNLKPAYTSRNLTCDIAVITNNIGTSNNMTLSELTSLKSQGFGILSHSKSHSSSVFRDNIPTTADSVYDDELGNSQLWLKNNGFGDVDTIVYPYGGWTGANAVKIKALASKYYSYGINAVGAYNQSPVDNMCVNRIFLNKNTDISIVQAQIDTAITNNGWIVFGHHSWDAENIDASYVGQVLDYLISKNIQIMNVADAIKIKGNVISAGEFTSGARFFVGMDGKSSIGATPIKVIQGNYSGTMDDAVTIFDQYKFTILEITNVKDTLLNLGGVLWAYHGDPYYSYETYYVGNGQRVYLRWWNDSGQVWTTWVEISSSLTVNKTTYSGTMDDAVTIFTQYKENIVHISAGKDNLLGVGGILKVVRMQPYFDYALFYPVGVDSLVYRRTWNQTTSVWNPWVLVGRPRVGTSTIRQAIITTTLHIGEHWFDTTLNKPLWVKAISPTIWVDATGTVIS